MFAQNMHPYLCKNESKLKKGELLKESFLPILLNSLQTNKVFELKAVFTTITLNLRACIKNIFLTIRMYYEIAEE